MTHVCCLLTAAWQVTCPYLHCILRLSSTGRAWGRNWWGNVFSTKHEYEKVTSLFAEFELLYNLGINPELFHYILWVMRGTQEAAGCC